MPELTPQERLQPSLLDRLTDDEPDQRVESREKRILSASQLQESVIRDLVWLINTEFLANSIEMDEYPLAKKSVINFGIPPLSGSTASSINVPQLTKKIVEAIRAFEPRLTDGTVQLTARRSYAEMSHNTLRFELEAELWAQPLPLHLFLMTEVDLETGQCKISEATPP